MIDEGRDLGQHGWDGHDGDGDGNGDGNGDEDGNEDGDVNGNGDGGDDGDGDGRQRKGGSESQGQWQRVRKVDEEKREVRREKRHQHPKKDKGDESC